MVPGRGNPSSSLWFVGEAPGRKEDETGVAFVGRAGRLLDRCIEKANITSFNTVNLLKCRPPDNRNPTEAEVHVCTNAWLYKQLDEYNPRVIMALGRFSIGFFKEYTWNQIINMHVTKEIK
ncbi:MAG: uracil-DNA glycosylase, partial [Desulfobacteraceae bacterium]